jgi:hypothetical protein
MLSYTRRSRLTSVTGAATGRLRLLFLIVSQFVDDAEAPFAEDAI